MAGKIKTSTLNCTENTLTSYSVSGVPLTTASFTKTFTVVANHIFSKPPSIDLSGVSDRNSYSVAINDTGSVAGGNLTVRTFVVTYTFPLKEVVGDVVSFVASAELDIANSVGKIYNYNLDESWVRGDGTTRTLTIFGDESDANNAAADLTVDFQRNNSSIRVAPDGSTGSGTAVIPTGGVYSESLVFPPSANNKTFKVILTQRAANSFLTLSTPKTITINQYVDPTITVNLTESASDFIVSGDDIVYTGEPFSTSSAFKEFNWYITAQSSTMPLKYVGTFDLNDFSGYRQYDGSVRLAGATKLVFERLSVEIYSGTTAVTSGNTATTTVTLTSANTSIIKGMRVTGSGITASGASSCIVAAVSGVTVTLNVAPGGTISSGTTLTFHQVAHVYGQVRFKKLGISTVTSSLDAASIIGINQPPVPSFTGTTNITAEEAGSFTTMTLAATDAESDTLTFKVTVMPAHGTFKYTDAQGSLQTVTCTGQTLTSNNTIHATTRTVQYKPADGNSTNTGFTYTVADPYNPVVTTAITINISAG